MTKDEILNKAKIILLKKEDERLHNRICEEANICPECGNELKDYEDEELNDIKECPINSHHFKKITYYNNNDYED